MKFALFSSKEHYCLMTFYLLNKFSFEIELDIVKYRTEVQLKEENTKYFYQFHVAGN